LSAIDVHNHFFPDALPDFNRHRGGAPWPSVRRTGADTATVMIGDKPFREIDSRCWDAERRLADMARDDVDLQVISATPVLFAYQRAAVEAAELAKLMNDSALELAARGQGRLKTLAQVPLQDIDAACREAGRAIKAGHLGVQIGNHVGPLDLDDGGLVTFLHHCADIGAAVLVHPWDMLGGARTQRFMMAWTVSMPAETHLSIVAMILGGAFDRLPRSLRICFAHGGGSFAFLLGRLENAWLNNDSARGKSQHPPSRYLDRFFVDSAVFEERTLRFLVDIMGADRVVLGSDYPFPLGEQRVGALVRGASSLSDDEKRRILEVNPRRFLGLAKSVRRRESLGDP